MIADRTLYIDEHGALVDAPPQSGLQLGNAGADIPPKLVQLYGLELHDGKVWQRGKPPKEGKPSTPPPMIADRDLFIDHDGTLAESGVKIASAGGEVAQFYINEYRLELRDEKVAQKARKGMPNKAVADAPNKGGGLTIKRLKK